MTQPNVFTTEVSNELIGRISNLQPSSKPNWGKMSVDQMLAHCSVAYEMAYENNHPAPNWFMKFIIKSFVKETVVGNKPYKRNSPTSPAFLIKENKDFELEKSRLVNYIIKTQETGEDYFDNKESLSFGVLTKNEWNTMFYKHLDHHLAQFGA